MSLFKILKGDSSRINLDSTPFHDGYAYFTPDDGGFYIDAEDGESQRRIRVNPLGGGESVSVNATLLASGWVDGKQTVAVGGVTAGVNGLVGVAPEATSEQVTAAKVANLHLSAQDVGSVTISTYGTAPTCDIPIVIILIG